MTEGATPRKVPDHPNTTDQYCAIITAQMQQALQNQRAAIETAAIYAADALATDHFLYVFGTGHSHMLAEEVFYRAGGLARAAAVLDPPLMLHQSAVESSTIERTEGYARRILSGYTLSAGDILVIASNSGRNAVPIEMALEARARGVRTIAITSVAHSKAFPSRHTSGKHLHELTDVVLDNLAVPGDAALTLPGMPRNIGPTSTLLGVFLLNLVVVRAIELAVGRGHVPDVYASSNADVPGWNETLTAKYRDRIRHLVSSA
jgi:uncharacterized phosphosugar-binding protein